MKQTLLLLSLSVTAISAQAQSIKFKNDKVLVDGAECLIDNSTNVNNIELATNDGKQTILLNFVRTGAGSNGGLYTKVIFVEQQKSLTSRSYIFTKKLLVSKLLSDKVLVDCAIDENAIDKFIMKYDEKIEDALLRY